MTDGSWADLGPQENFPNNQQVCVDNLDFPLVVMNVDGEFYAVENRCPHAGRPLGDGERRGMTLTCPYHGYTYHIKTGKNIDNPDYDEPVRTFPIRVHEGRLQVQFTDAKG